MDFLVKHLVLLLTFFSAFCANGCLNKQEPKPHNPSPNAQATTTPNDSDFDKFMVTEDCASTDKFYGLCINGVCQVDINTDEETRRSYCKCNDRYRGAYCETFKKPAIRISSVMAAGIACGLLLIIVVAVTVYVCWIRKRHQRSKSLESAPRGTREATPSRFSQYSSPSAAAYNNNVSASAPLTPTQNGNHPESIELLHVRTEGQQLPNYET